MKNLPQSGGAIMRETRTEVIVRFTEAMLRERRISPETFSQDLLEQYHLRVPSAARIVEFKTDGDPFRRAGTNAQRLRRYMQGDVNFPADLEEAWVEALPDPYRSDCKRELARRYGFLDVPLPDISGISDAVTLGRLTGEFAKLLQDMAPIVQNGGHSAQQLVAARAEVDQLIASAEGLAALLQREAEQLGPGLGG